MSHEDFLLSLYCIVDQLMKDTRTAEGLRQRGPAPVLSDAEVITIVVAGEFFGLDADTAIFRYFRRYHAAAFPALKHLVRTTFVRQAANLGPVIQRLWQRLPGFFRLADPVTGDVLWLVDSFPLRVCRLKRAPSCQRFRGQAAYGYDPTAGKDAFYGFRVHLRCAAQGPAVQMALAPGNVPDLTMLWEILPPEGGWAVADRSYWSPETQRDLARQGCTLVAPFKKESSDPTPRRSQILSKLRQYIEPLIGQLARRFHIETTWARDLWHLTGRLWRKLLSHTLAVYLNVRQGHPPLQLELLLND